MQHVLEGVGVHDQGAGVPPTERAIAVKLVVVGRHCSQEGGCKEMGISYFPRRLTFGRQSGSGNPR